MVGAAVEERKSRSSPTAVDALQHLQKIPADRDLLDGPGQLSVFDPDAVRPARVISGDHVGAAAQHRGHIESVLDAADDGVRLVLAGH